jgi:hypothetical protein
MIREPEGVDLVIMPHKFTEKDRQITIEAIAESKLRLQKTIIPERERLSFRQIVAL